MLRLNRITILSLVTAASLFSSCGLFPGQSRAADVVDAFYSYQLDDGTPFPVDLFADSQVAIQAESLINRREMVYGSHLSHKRISTNRQISIEGNGRKESVTYIYEVTGGNGKTRETLMLSRNKGSDPFLITAYVIEDIPWLQVPNPAGTSSA